MRSRNWCLTLNLERNDIESYINSFDNITFAEVKGYIIGAIEKGKDNNYTHCHALLCFVNAIEFNTVREYFGDIHIESCTSKKKYRDYMKKEGEFIIDTLGISTDDDDIFNDLLNSPTLTDFFRLHPNLLSRYKNYADAYTSLNRKTNDEGGLF